MTNLEAENKAYEAKRKSTFLSDNCEMLRKQLEALKLENAELKAAIEKRDKGYQSLLEEYDKLHSFLVMNSGAELKTAVGSKPPIGVQPKSIWLNARLTELSRAIYEHVRKEEYARRAHAREKVMEWSKEIIEILQNWKDGIK